MERHGPGPAGFPSAGSPAPVRPPEGGRGWPFLVLGILGAIPLLPGGGAAQEMGDCDVYYQEYQYFTNSGTGDRIWHFRFPTFVCGSGVRINADSAIVHEAIHYTQLFRNVVFREDDTRLEAAQAYYFSDRGLLRAWGGPVLTRTDDGSVIRGDTMELRRAGEEGAEERLTVWGRRPSATLYPGESAGDSAGTAALDSLAVDAAGPPGDSISALPDTTSLPPDSMARDPDTLPLRPDTLAAAADTAGGGRTPDEPRERTPYEIEAQRIVLEGKGFFLATGAVTLRRDSLNARADSMEYREGSGALLLDGNAWVETASTELAARSIRLDLPQDEIRAAVAREEAVLESDDLQLLAPLLHLYFNEGEIERLVALRDPALDSLTEEELLLRPPHPLAQTLGLGRFPLRPFAVAEDFLLSADSIEAEVAGDVLDELWAVGNARGESTARDSLNTPETPSLIRRDWIEGDTIIATFLPAEESASAEEGGPVAEGILPDSGDVVLPPEADLPLGARAQVADTSGASYVLDRLTARGRAKSLYRLEAADSTLAAEGKLATHYVVGAEIVIYMVEGEVEHMEVKGQTQGIHMEPLPGERGGGGERAGTEPPASLPGPKGGTGERPRPLIPSSGGGGGR